MSLDEKLREIVADMPYPDAAVETIKQAFTDSGYLNSVRMNGKTIVMNGKDPLGQVVYWPDKAMTGQEWYDRFEKELEHKVIGVGYGGQDALYVFNYVVGAAKKAAGLK